MDERETRMRDALAPLRDTYEYIFIDCPPSLGLLTLNALTAADSVIIPIQCEYYALEGVGQLVNTLNLVRKRLNPSLDVEGVVLTMLDGRTNLGIQVVGEVKRHFKGKVFGAIVPRNVRLSEAPSHGKPIHLYDAKCPGAEAYFALADELMEKEQAMSTGKRGLGRGLDALLGTDAPEEQIAGHIDAVMQLPITKIDVNPGQPRRTFDEKALMELAESIRSVGVIQPIVVAQRAGRYTIIAGERRYRAARLAGLKEMPAIVRDWDEAVRLEAALIENLQREDLNPIEEALGVKNLMEQCGYTQERAAERLGKSRPAVANLLRLLTLDERVIEMVRAGQLSAGHARALVTVSKERQVKLAELTVQQGFSVRQLERICAQPEPEKKDAPAEKPVRAGELNDLERMAREIFGTRAKIEGDEDKGRLILNYYSQDDLQRIWEILEFMRQGGA